MTIKNLMIYEPKLKELKTEKDIIDLIESVSIDLHGVDSHHPKLTYKSVLQVIESGEYEFKERGSNIYNSIDLSKAKQFMNQYKYFSEGGCKSCKKVEYSKPFPDETLSYCSLYENKAITLKKFENSPRIKEYSQKGCDEREPIFRPLEELLKDYS